MNFLNKSFKCCIINNFKIRQKSYNQIENISNLKYYSCLTNNIDKIKNDNKKNISASNYRLYHIEQNGLFKYLSDSYPVEITQNFLVSFHDTSGLPWWGSIILSTVLVRSAITFPLAIYTNYISAKLQNLHLEMPDIVKELTMETAYAKKKFNWTEEQARFMFKRSLKKQWNKLIIRDNCHPLKGTLLLWIQIPMWVFFSVALRNLAYMMPEQTINAKIIFNQLCIEGFLWIPNLTDIDHSLILPISLGLFNLAVTEIHVLLRTNPESKLQRYITNFFRIFSILMIPISAFVPSALCLYWTTSTVFGLCQNLLLISPKFRRICKIPVTNKDNNKPYEHLVNQISEKFSFVKRQTK